ncbi:7TM diverse intracellular signaling domain-containing protein [Bernardetia sp.]|uniref:7TM diverse intracellular signaling domain-containing protein n=1 Tax=Bernardetia sp. TaxID=1937974 RepID=UPI0025C2B76D|nr:7TM diverse intracellular signaling domain-containing protein [Bernardetia sp.]
METVLINDVKIRLKGGEIGIFEDKNHSKTFAQISDKDFVSNFETYQGYNPNFGFSKSVFWVRLELENQNKEQDEFLLEIAAPLLDSITFFQKNGEKYESIITGDAFEFKKRPVANRYFLFPFNLKSQEKQIFYFKISSEASLMQFPLRVWTPLAFEQYNHQFQFIFGIIYGIIIFILINNLFLYFSLGKGNSYAYYVVAMAFSLLVIASLNGHAYEYLWSDFPFLQQKALPMCLTLLDFFLVLFCRRFLNTHIFLKKFDKALRIFGFVQLGFFVLTIFLPYQYAMFLSNISATATAIVLLVTGTSATLRGNKSAWFFMSGFSVYILGYIIFALKTSSLIPLNPFTEYSVQVGAALQVILLSFALGIRIREIRNERNEVQRIMMESQKEANEQLESKVEERTSELNEKAEALENSYRTVSILSSIGQEITASLDYEAIFSVLYRYVHELMDSPFFGVDLYYPEKEQIVYVYNIENEVLLPEQKIDVNNPNNLSAYVVRKRESIFINDAETEIKNYLPNVEIVIGEAPKSVIAMPLLVGERVLGVVSVQSFEKNAYTSQHLEIMKTLASYTAIALENASSYSQIRNVNTKTMQSIRYAQRIQEGLLPRPRILSDNFDDASVFYRPRDVVSGDFYWFETLLKEDFSDELHQNMPNKLKMIVVGDCTGHGVPGALMTIMGINLLNQIIAEGGTWQPDEILEGLDERVRHTFHLEEQLNPKNRRNDGMDIGICAVDEEERVIYYAGAKMPLYIVRNGKLEIIKGSPFAIGGSFISKKKQKEYKINIFRYEKGDNLFLASDGFQDQFGGNSVEGRKYYTRFFREFLEKISPLSAAEQYSAFTKELIRWKNKRKQTDDILVLSAKL